MNIRSSWVETLAFRKLAWLSKALIVDPRTYCWCSVLLAIASLYVRLGSSKDIDAWITSDTLWPVNLIIDIFHDHYHLSGWLFSIAPCWFPDVFLTGLTYAITRNAISATLLAGFLQFLLLVLGICLCWRALRLPNVLAAESMTLLTAAGITLIVAFGLPALPATYQFFLPQTHVGNLVNVVYALLLVLLLFHAHTRGARVLLAAAYGILCFLSAISNMLFAAHFLAPLTVATAFLYGFRKLTLRDSLPSLLGWPAFLAGVTANRAWFKVTDVSVQSSVGWKPFKLALDVFWRNAFLRLRDGDLEHVLALFWLAGCVAAALLMLGREEDPDSGRVRVSRALFFLSAAGASLGSAAAMVAGGSASLAQLNSYRATIRYLHPMLLLPLIAWPGLVVLAPWPQRFQFWMRAALVAAGLSATTAMAAVLVRTGMNGVPVHRYVPQFVRQLDLCATRYGLKYGYADYWHARVITLLSTTGLRVYQVNSNLKPFHWVNNLEWYEHSFEDRSVPPEFSFAVLQGPPLQIGREDVISVMGAPGGDIVVDGVDVLVYPEKTQAKRRIICSMPDISKAALSKSVALDFSGSCLDGSVGRADGRLWSMGAPRDAAGFVVLPRLPLPAGTYVLRIDYTASNCSGDSLGAVDIGCLDRRLLASARLPVGTGPFESQFTVPAEMAGRNVKIRIFFEGFGAIVVRRLVVRKVGR